MSQRTDTLEKSYIIIGLIHTYIHTHTELYMHIGIITFLYLLFPGGIMMEGGMMGMGECGPDHHMPLNGPMCDEYGRGRNVSIVIFL